MSSVFAPSRQFTEHQLWPQFNPTWIISFVVKVHLLLFLLGETLLTCAIRRAVFLPNLLSSGSLDVFLFTVLTFFVSLLWSLQLFHPDPVFNFTNSTCVSSKCSRLWHVTNRSFLFQPRFWLSCWPTWPHSTTILSFDGYFRDDSGRHF